MFKQKTYESLRAALRIDMLRLDEELIEHPARLQDVIEIAADALQLRDEAKSSLDLCIADAAQTLRLTSEEKLSEIRIASLVQLDTKVIEATREYEDAKHDLAYWQGLVDSTKEKGGALRRIAELTIAGYLAPNAAYTKQKEELAVKRRAVIRKPE